MLEIAEAVVIRRQDVLAREHDVAKRRQELTTRERELLQAKEELRQLELRFTTAATGLTGEVGGTEPMHSVALVTSPGPSLARANATIAHRVLGFLEMEPRAFSPLEIHNRLELPPPIETLRTTLWKMATHGLIARPFHGMYCACQYGDAIRRAASAAG